MDDQVDNGPAGCWHRRGDERSRFGSEPRFFERPFTEDGVGRVRPGTPTGVTANGIDLKGSGGESGNNGGKSGNQGGEHGGKGGGKHGGGGGGKEHEGSGHTPENNLPEVPFAAALPPIMLGAFLIRRRARTDL